MNRTRKQNILNHSFVRKVSSDIWALNMVKGINKKPKWKIIQKGGGSISVGDYTFLYDEDSNVILSVAKPGGICFKISFDLTTKSIGIDIGYFPKCSVTKPLEKGTGTLAMSHAIFELILSNKEIKQYEKIVITDNSSIDCISFIDNKSYKTRLMDMYYVCTGCTWYSSLVPIFLHNELDDELFETERQNIVGEYAFSFNEFIDNLTLSEKEIKFLKKISDEFITFDKSNPGSASTILNEIRKNRKYCIIFQLFIDNFLSAFYSRSLYGKEWIVALDDGFIVAPEDNKCMKESGYLIPKEKLKFISNEDYNSLKKSLYISKPKIDFEFVLEKI